MKELAIDQMNAEREAQEKIKAERVPKMKKLIVRKPIRKGPKIYPNDPCHCGSGKKYKKCCSPNK